VEDMGGAVAAIEAGWMQSQIEDAAYREARAQEAGESVVVGVNRFISGDGEPIPVLRVDPDLERSQVARVQAWRAGRDGDIVELLARVEETARTTENLLPVMRDALRSGATIGEVSETLRAVFGTHR
jgi:methylmalonyl-CoA mutase, N-terminal domain